MGAVRAKYKLGMLVKCGDLGFGEVESVVKTTGGFSYGVSQMDGLITESDVECAYKPMVPRGPRGKGGGAGLRKNAGRKARVKQGVKQSVKPDAVTPTSDPDYIQTTNEC